MESTRHNIFILWKPEYSVGNTRLDAQHRKIVALINELHDAVSGVYETDIAAVLKSLNEYTRNHLDDEERFLDEHEFPELAEHVVSHRFMREKTTKLCLQYATERDEIKYDILRFLKEWWIGHITGTDRHYADYFRDRVQS